MVRGGLNYETGVSLEQRWLSGYVTCYTSTRTRKPLGVGTDVRHFGVVLDKLGELKLSNLTRTRGVLKDPLHAGSQVLIDHPALVQGLLHEAGTILHSGQLFSASISMDSWTHSYSAFIVINGHGQEGKLHHNLKA